MRRSALALLPQLVTFFGIFWGVLAIEWSTTSPYAACVAVLLACVCDLLDGAVARWTGTSSLFGAQLDSLADVITCGIAPAFVIHHWALYGFYWGSFDLYFLLLFLYVVCVASRLARYNAKAIEAVEEGHEKCFTGIPSPVGAMFLCAVVMAHEETGLAFFKSPSFLIPLILIVSALMVSTIPFRSFKSIPYRWVQIVFVISGLTLITIGGPSGTLLFACLLLYLLYGLINLQKNEIRS